MIEVVNIPFGKWTKQSAGSLDLVTFTPGNGTAYSFILTKVVDPVAKSIGCTSGDYMVSYRSGTGVRTWYFGSGGIAHTSYVKEKLNIQGDDLLSVTAAINALIPSYSTEYGEKCFDSIRKNLL